MKTVWFLCLALLVTGCATLPPTSRQTYTAVSAAETPSSAMVDDSCLVEGGD
jgi:starvation-inducible outer membrane lipoprotein